MFLYTADVSDNITDETYLRDILDWSYLQFFRIEEAHISWKTFLSISFCLFSYCYQQVSGGCKINLWVDMNTYYLVIFCIVFYIILMKINAFDLHDQPYHESKIFHIDHEWIPLIDFTLYRILTSKSMFDLVIDRYLKTGL